MAVGLMSTEALADQKGQEQGEQEETPNVSPEEQAQYNRFVDNGLQIIFDEEAAKKILSHIDPKNDPAEGLAAATANIVMRLQESAMRNGKPVGNAVILHGTIELLENVAELSKAAGVHTFEQNELENALYKTMDRIGTFMNEQGLIDKDELSGDLQALVDADQSGGLDALLGEGFTESANGLGQGEN